MLLLNLTGCWLLTAGERVSGDGPADTDADSDTDADTDADTDTDTDPHTGVESDGNDGPSTAVAWTANGGPPHCEPLDLGPADLDWVRVEGLSGAATWFWVSTATTVAPIDTKLTLLDPTTNGDTDVVHGLPFGLGPDPALAVVGRGALTVRIEAEQPGDAGDVAWCVQTVADSEEEPENDSRATAGPQRAPTPMSADLEMVVGGSAGSAPNPDYVMLEPGTWRVATTNPAAAVLSGPVELTGSIDAQTTVTVALPEALVAQEPAVVGAPPDAGLMAFGPSTDAPYLFVPTQADDRYVLVVQHDPLGVAEEEPNDSPASVQEVAWSASNEVHLAGVAEGADYVWLESLLFGPVPLGSADLFLQSTDVGGAAEVSTRYSVDGLSFDDVPADGRVSDVSGAGIWVWIEPGGAAGGQWFLTARGYP